MLPLATQAVPIDDDCVGDRWAPQDQLQLARLVAIIAMGQATYAAHIIQELVPAAPAFTSAELRHEATIRLTVQEARQATRVGYPRWQRDGFIFEAISWIAARQVLGPHTLLKEPHISSTSQGLDGLMIELSDDKSGIIATTIFEDKCTDNPRDTFSTKVMRAFADRHKNKRSAELVATASTLLRMAGIPPAAAAVLSAAVLDRAKRRYRAAFALTQEYDSQDKRRELFEGFGALDGIPHDQRIGSSFIVSGALRDWFDSLASSAVAFLTSEEASKTDV